MLVRASAIGPGPGGTLCVGMRNSRAARWGSALAAAAALATACVAASGCGASSTVDPLAQAAQVTARTSGVHVAMVMQVSSSKIPAPFTISASGYLDESRHAGRISFDLSNLPQIASLGDPHMELVLLYPVMYMKMPFLASHLHGHPWIKIDLSQAGKSAGLDLSPLSSLGGGQNPADGLEFLRGSGGSTRVGSEVIDGVRTERYRTSIRLSDLVARAPSSARASLEHTLSQLGKLGAPSSFPLEAWIDERHRVRRERFELTENPAGLGSITTIFNMEFTDYGPVPPIVAPPAGEVFDATSLASAGISKALSH